MNLKPMMLMYIENYIEYKFAVRHREILSNI